MADILRIFNDIGESFSNDFTPNQINKQNYTKILCYGIEDRSLDICDHRAISNRLFLRVISANGGNLYPILALKEAEFIKALKKAISNTEKYLPKEEKEAYSALIQKICFDDLEEKIGTYSALSTLFALFNKNPLEGGESISELFPSAAENFSEQLCAAEHSLNATCFINGQDTVGFDPMLPFCSTNEMSAKMSKYIKPKLLPLGNSAATHIRYGFEKIFKDGINKSFKFNLFGQSYVLLPSVFKGEKRKIYDKICAASAEYAAKNKNDIASKSRLEMKLQSLIGDEDFSDSILLTFLFYKQNNNEIVLYQTIEDVAPSRIRKAAELMQPEAYDIVASQLSKYLKKNEKITNAVYIRDYINNGIILARLIFGQEKIASPDILYSLINNKILYGNNNPNNKEKRSFSKIISDYFADDTNFDKHQRFISFLYECNSLKDKNINIKGADMDFEDLKSMVQHQLEHVDILKSSKAKEMYILGALAKLVINWQYHNNSTSLANWLDSIGSANISNKDRLFTKIYKASRNYQIYGNEYDYLLEEYSNVKAKNDGINISADTANIAFVMGSVNYKSYKDGKKEKSNDK